MTVANRGLVDRFYELMGADVVDTLSGDRMVELGELMAGEVTDDFECLMVGPVGADRYPGLRGFARAWRDWVSPYTSFRIEIEEVIELGTAVVVDVRQVGVTRHAGVPIENGSSSIWHFRDGLLQRAVFYLDRETAHEAAGIIPKR